jgi:hypothetical protein
MSAASVMRHVPGASKQYVTALPLDDPLVHVVQQNPTTIKVGHIGIVCGTWTGYLMIVCTYCLLMNYL